MKIVPIYSAIFALMFVLLSVRVISARRSQKVSLGASGNKLVERAMRVQGNFAEYALLLLYML